MQTLESLCSSQVLADYNVPSFMYVYGGLKIVRATDTFAFAMQDSVTAIKQWRPQQLIKHHLASNGHSNYMNISRSSGAICELFALRTYSASMPGKGNNYPCTVACPTL